MDAAQNPAVVVGADDHAVEILAVEQCTVILEDLPLSLAFGSGIVAALQPAVGHGHHFSFPGQLVDEQIAAVAHADHTHADAVVGAHDAAGSGGQPGSGEESSGHRLVPLLVRFWNR